MTTDAAASHATVTPELRQQIEALSIEYAWLIDHGQADRVAELFTEDATLNAGEEQRGITAIRDTLAKRAVLDVRTRHLVSNVRLVSEAEDRIRGTVILTVYRRNANEVGEPEVVIVGEADDLYERGADGRWRFAKRHLEPIFAPVSL